MFPRECYFRYQRGRLCPFIGRQGGIGLDGGAAKRTRIYSRYAQQRMPHPHGHTQYTCRRTHAWYVHFEGQRAADHSHPAAHNTENRFSIKHFLIRLSHAAACTPTPDLASPQTHHAARSYRCGPMACVLVLKGPAIDLPTRHTEDCIGAVGQGRKNKGAQG